MRTTGIVERTQLLLSPQGKETLQPHWEQSMVGCLPSWQGLQSQAGAYPPPAMTLVLGQASRTAGTHLHVPSTQFLIVIHFLLPACTRVSALSLSPEGFYLGQFPLPTSAAGLTAHTTRRPSCRTSKRQMVVWLNIFIKRKPRCLRSSLGVPQQYPHLFLAAWPCPSSFCRASISWDSWRV